MYQEQKRYDEAIQSYRSAIHYRPRMASKSSELSLRLFENINVFTSHWCRSGSFKYGPSSGSNGNERRGNRGIPALLAARRVWPKGPSNTRDHQNICSLQPRPPLR